MIEGNEEVSNFLWKKWRLAEAEWKIPPRSFIGYGKLQNSEKEKSEFWSIEVVQNGSFVSVRFIVHWAPHEKLKPEETLIVCRNAYDSIEQHVLRARIVV